jgi:hypothetical protein
MRGAGLRGLSRRRWLRTTVRNDDIRPAPDLVKRSFDTTDPDQLWVADITYIVTWTGQVQARFASSRAHQVPSPVRDLHQDPS